jgi:hypothetical protein
MMANTVVSQHIWNLDEWDFWMKDPLVVCSVEWSNSCPFMLGNHPPGEPIRMDG